MLAPTDADRLRDALARARFNTVGVAEVIGANGFGFLARGDLGPVLRRTAGGSPIETLIRLFLCGVAVPAVDAERALPLTREIVDVRGESVTARCAITPTTHDGREWLVPSDAARGDRAADYVNGVGPASMTLAGLTIRRPVRRALDLGCGSGVQTLFASAHVESIVATDRNARATAFADFAMRLNGVPNIETRTGDLFEPVAGEHFDLIVSNPPFVISPEARFIYRDSGLAGDEISRRIVAEAPTHLNEGGWCQLLANWAHLRNEDWQDRVAGWIDDIGCDAWVVQSRVEEAETYASGWIRHDYPDGNPALFDEWMTYYERIGLEAVGFGLITLRKTERAQPWRCVEELGQEFVLPCGDDIAAAFDRAIWLDTHDDRSLLDAVLVVSPHATLQQTHFAAEGEWFLDRSLLQLERGLHYAISIDALGADLVAGCDASTRLGDLVHRLADTLGVDAAAIVPSCVAIVRRMIQQGFVTPV